MSQDFAPNEPSITTSDGLDKITIIHNTPNYDMVTFCLNEEDHTLGNVLRWMCMKDEDVEFCGYSAPHPSEPKIHLRVQMYEGKSAVHCLMKALANLRDMYNTIQDKYATDVEHGDYTKEDDRDIRAEVNEIVQEAYDNKVRVAEERKALQSGDVEMS